MSGPIDRTVRAAAAVSWSYFAWQSAVVAFDADRPLVGVAGAVACLFTALLLAIHAVTGRSPFRLDD